MSESSFRLAPEEVDHVALLARLDITPEERELFAEQLGAVLHWVDQLQELPTEGVEAEFFVQPRTNVMREDRVHEPLGPEGALANAPDRQGDYFRIPRILDEEE